MACQHYDGTHIRGAHVRVRACAPHTIKCTRVCSVQRRRTAAPVPFGHPATTEQAPPAMTRCQSGAVRTRDAAAHAIHWPHGGRSAMLCCARTGQPKKVRQYAHALHATACTNNMGPRGRTQARTRVCRKLLQLLPLLHTTKTRVIIVHIIIARPIMRDAI